LKIPGILEDPKAETGEIALAAAHFAGLKGGTASRQPGRVETPKKRNK